MIMNKMKMLQNEGIEINIHWTPGHADINGNEIADCLAKEAAKEADQLPTTDAHITITKQDIKKAAKDHVMMKWQKRWELSDRGRFYYNYHQNVKQKCNHDFPDKSSATIINNLRSGYAKLNDYCHKINITESPNCQCGEKETVEHFILYCEQYEEAREKLVREQFLLSGTLHLDLEILLTVGKQEDETLTETERARLLTQYVKETNRFNLI